MPITRHKHGKGCGIGKSLALRAWLCLHLLTCEQVNNSGLKIFSITDLQEAAEKAVDFSKIVKMARDIDVGVEFSLGI